MPNGFYLENSPGTEVGPGDGAAPGIIEKALGNETAPGKERALSKALGKVASLGKRTGSFLVETAPGYGPGSANEACLVKAAVPSKEAAPGQENGSGKRTGPCQGPGPVKEMKREGARVCESERA